MVARQSFSKRNLNLLFLVDKIKNKILISASE